MSYFDLIIVCFIFDLIFVFNPDKPNIYVLIIHVYRTFDY